MTDKYQTLMNGLSIESLSSFVKAFKSQLFVEGLVQGNFTSRVSTASAADTHSHLSLRCVLTQLPHLQHSPDSLLSTGNLELCWDRAVSPLTPQECSSG